MSTVHADIDALREFREALGRFGSAQLELAARAQDAIELTRGSLEAKAADCRSRLEQCRAELEACRERAAAGAEAGREVDCSVYAEAFGRAGERLEQVRRWQQRVEEEASEFRVAADRFADLVEADVPRAEAQLTGMAARLAAARQVRAADA